MRALLLAVVLFLLGATAHADAKGGPPPKWVQQKIHALFPAKEKGGYDRFYHPVVVSRTAKGYVVAGSPANNGVRTLFVTKTAVTKSRELEFGAKAATQRAALFYHAKTGESGFLASGAGRTSGGAAIRVEIEPQGTRDFLREVRVPIVGHGKLGQPKLVK